MDNKLSELKAAAMAATPGPWAAELNEVWVISDGTADFMLTDIFGDNELSAEQDRANARFIAAANPAVVLELLAERDADKKRIAELEAKLATPVRLPRTIWYEHDDLAHEIPVLEKKKVVAEIRAAGFTVEGG
ncbi:ead/Ea22-like family protein [Serratia marcescens]